MWREGKRDEEDECEMDRDSCIKKMRIKKAGEMKNKIDTNRTWRNNCYYYHYCYSLFHDIQIFPSTFHLLINLLESLLITSNTLLHPKISLRLNNYQYVPSFLHSVSSLPPFFYHRNLNWSTPQPVTLLPFKSQFNNHPFKTPKPPFSQEGVRGDWIIGKNENVWVCHRTLQPTIIVYSLICKCRL